ncbi:16840_t:CDS:2, partial [Funneliformis geosporum]
MNNNYFSNIPQQGEALELLTSLPDNSTNLVFLDPQYEPVNNVLKLDYPLYSQSDYQILSILEQKYPQNSKLFKNRSLGNVWEENSLATSKRKHPHQKPRELIKALIEATTQKDDLIIDPCAGSFIVLEVCQELEREFLDLVTKFCEEMQSIPGGQKDLNPQHFEIRERGLSYQGAKRIDFYDLFSYQRARGAIARTTYQEIVFEEAIPIDQEFLYGQDGNKLPLQTKITFLANPYLFSAWFLDVFKRLHQLRKEAEEKKLKKDNSGVLEIAQDEQGEKLNPSTVNWDEFMIDEPNKYKIIHAIQDFYFCELGERKVHKKFCLMHFTKNKKETDS